MTRLSDYAKTRITLLHEQSYGINEIVRILESEDVHTTRQTVAKFIRKHKLIKFTLLFLSQVNIYCIFSDCFRGVWINLVPRVVVDLNSANIHF